MMTNERAAHTLPPSAQARERARGVTAILGPTNTGKTHFAIERMLAHRNGMIGLPLRLLAREVYNRICAEKGEGVAALVTGEEKIIPPEPRYWVATVEAMPLDIECEFVAVDEVQLAADLERGHIFTDRILNARGRHETLLLGSATVRALLVRLLPGLDVVTRPRLSQLTHAGARKLTRMPPRSAVIAFSALDVYSIAELIRRQHGGAAVVLGSLSPRTRNAQVDLFQNGDVAHMVATDAIGLGLNLDLDHIAFAGRQKFDGFQLRPLTAAEMGQIAGRAGRHRRDGSFGVTGPLASLDPAIVGAIEQHSFAALKCLQWRNGDIDTSSLASLEQTLRRLPGVEGLVRALPAADWRALEALGRNREICALADTPQRVALMWEICQIPDYSKITPAMHVELISTIFAQLARQGTICEEWFAGEVGLTDRVDGDIDTLSARLARVRSWSYIANRADWLGDPAHWRGVTQTIENRLSDALHDLLTRRFIDRRTSVLMRRMREHGAVNAHMEEDGRILVEDIEAGQMDGLSFVPAGGTKIAGRAEETGLNGAIRDAVRREVEARAALIAAAQDKAFSLSAEGALIWQGAPVARLVAGDDLLMPALALRADDLLAVPLRARVGERLQKWLRDTLEEEAAPLFLLRAATASGAQGRGFGSAQARGLAFRLVENFGIVPRAAVGDVLRDLPGEDRAPLRRAGVRFGARHIYIPALLKPRRINWLAHLHRLAHAELWKGCPGQPSGAGQGSPAPRSVKPFAKPLPDGFAQLAALWETGRTSVPRDPAVAAHFYLVFGFAIVANRAVRVDVLERLSDLIRIAMSYRPGPPPGKEARLPVSARPARPEEPAGSQTLQESVESAKAMVSGESARRDMLPGMLPGMLEERAQAGASSVAAPSVAGASSMEDAPSVEEEMPLPGGEKGLPTAPAQAPQNAALPDGVSPDAATLRMSPPVATSSGASRSGMASSHTPPRGAVPEGGGFWITDAMCSLLGCSGPDLAMICAEFGFAMRRERFPCDVAARFAMAPARDSAAASSGKELSKGKAVPEPASPQSGSVNDVGTGSGQNHAAGSDAGSVTGGDPPEFVEIEVWRPARKKSSYRHVNRRRGAASGTASKDGQGNAPNMQRRRRGASAARHDPQTHRPGEDMARPKRGAADDGRPYPPRSGPDAPSRAKSQQGRAQQGQGDRRGGMRARPGAQSGARSSPARRSQDSPFAVLARLRAELVQPSRPGKPPGAAGPSGPPEKPRDPA